MVLKTRTLAIVVVILVATRAWSAEAPAPGEVNLPLGDYLALVEKAETVERERERLAKLREVPFAEVVAQHVRVELGDGEAAEVEVDFEVLVQGAPKGPIVLPVAGFPREAEVKLAGGPASQGPAAALSAGAKAGEWLLVAPSPGRYAVRLAGPAPLAGRGISRLALAPAAAPVSLTELELPADLAWSAPGTVIVEDRVAGTRRTVRLTARRGQAQTLEVRRKVDGGEAEKLLAQSLVLTLVQLLPDGPRRHDVVLYDVSRGGMASFTVELPPGLTVEQVGTDEGDVVPAVEARRLTVHRRKQLQGVGYLVLTSTPAPGSEVALAPVVPEIPVQARYTALSSAVAAEARLLPEAAWSRVDLDDLPPSLRDALGGVDLAAAWRLSGASDRLAMALSPLPAAPALPVVVSARETTTLLTMDGTLLHRDRFTLRAGALGTALDVALPAGASLWSARVDDLPVRPLERGNGTLSIPLGFDAGKDSAVEVVSVLEKAIPPGRSALGFELPRIAAPVLRHSLRLLLPDGNRYRFRAGDLRPAGLPFAAGVPTARDPWVALSETPGVATDRVNVGGNEGGRAVSGPGGTSAVLGNIKDDQGQPLPGVTVNLQGPFGSLDQTTDANGNFRFFTLPKGRYTLNAELVGFGSAQRPFDLADSRTASLEITLTAAIAEEITVTAEVPLIDERRTARTETFETDPSTGRQLRRRKDAPRPAMPGYYDFDAFEELQKGLVGGVKPLPIAIPESGKLLLMTAVLPPAEVKVELEVKAGRR